MITNESSDLYPNGGTIGTWSFDKRSAMMLKKLSAGLSNRRIGRKLLGSFPAVIFSSYFRNARVSPEAITTKMLMRLTILQKAERRLLEVFAEGGFLRLATSDSLKDPRKHKCSNLL